MLTCAEVRPASASFWTKASAFSSRVPSIKTTSRVLFVVPIAVTIVGEPCTPTSVSGTPKASKSHWVIVFLRALMIPEKLNVRGLFKSRVTVKTAGSLTRMRR